MENLKEETASAIINDESNGEKSLAEIIENELVINDEKIGEEFLLEFKNIQKYLLKKSKKLESILKDTVSLRIDLIINKKE